MGMAWVAYSAGNMRRAEGTEDMTTHRVTAGPFTLEIPSNGVAILYEADGAGDDHQLPGNIGHFEALVQFAGEVIRLRAMIAERELQRRQTPCLSAIASGEPCRPDDTLKRCAICGFIVDTKYAVEKPTMRLRP
jgi:hypothetical protein